jgi:hypothetical protein
MSLSGNQITRVGDMGAPGRAYAGFVAKAASALIIAQGLEFTAPINKVHFTSYDNRAHFTMPTNKAHFTVDE